MKTYTAVFAFAFTQATLAYEPERAMANQAHELAECAAYYSMMSGCAENTDPEATLSEDLEKIAMQAFYLSVDLSNIEVTTARVELAIKQLKEESMGLCSNSSILINKYAENCKVSIENPEARAEYWLNLGAKQD